jgi:lysophospholipase L1-like esterase
VLEGINDIGMSGPGGMLGDAPLAQPEELTAAYHELIERAHEHGIKVFGGTLLPFEGANYYGEPKERVRSEVNEWIRRSGQFDGVIDFDVVMRDPDHPRRMKTEFDSGDHLHPSAAGYRAMGRSVDPLLFR